MNYELIIDGIDAAENEDPYMIWVSSPLSIEKLRRALPEKYILAIYPLDIPTFEADFKLPQDLEKLNRTIMGLTR